MNSRPTERMFVFLSALVVALVFGSVAAWSVLDNDVDAQGASTWQTMHFETPFYDEKSTSERTFNVWIESLPAGCDVNTVAQGVSELVAYYRCP